MELRVLYYFLKTAELKSITKAAQALHLSQPTLSVQLKNLEEELHQTLLIRNARGTKKVELTEDGKLLQQRAEEIFQIVDKIHLEMKHEKDEIKGEISICAGESVNFKYIAKAMAKTNELYPNITFKLSSGNLEDVLYRIEKGTADCGFIFGVADHSVFNERSLKKEDIQGVLVRKDHPLASLEFVRPEDLISYPLILSSQEETDGWPILTRFNKALEDLNIVCFYSLFYNAYWLVKEGLGCAVLLKDLVEESKDCVFVPLKPEVTGLPKFIWKKERYQSAAFKEFLKILLEILEKENV